MAQAKQDMGSGSVKKLMLQLMIPAVVAQVVNLLGPAAGRKDHLQQLYGADALCSGADHRLLCGCARAAAAVRCQ